MDDELLTPLEVAAQLGVHPGTLANWRYMGLGPRYTKRSDHPNAAVRYRRSDVDAYARQTHRSAV